MFFEAKAVCGKNIIINLNLVTDIWPTNEGTIKFFYSKLDFVNINMSYNAMIDLLQKNNLFIKS